MIVDFFLKGLVIGFSIAIAIGPIGILCIQRTISRGFKMGILTGLGAATADGFYGIVAGTGIAAVSSFLISYQPFVCGIGSLFLFWLAFNTFRTVPVVVGAQQEENGTNIGSFISSFLLTLSNPMTILMFTAIFAGLGLMGSVNGYQAASSLVLGVFLGSVVWWLILAGVVSRIRERLSDTMIKRINQISGVLLFIFASYALVKALAQDTAVLL